MSCFLIDKRQYMQAGGFLAGLYEETKNSHYSSFNLYDYSRGRWYETSDYAKAAAWLYELNRVSVSVSWNEDQPRDNNDYAEAFNRYLKKGRQLARTGGKSLEKSIAGLQKFFSSVLYQIDEPKQELSAKSYIYRCCFSLDNYMQAYRLQYEEGTFWGDFELD